MSYGMKLCQLPKGRFCYNGLRLCQKFNLQYVSLWAVFNGSVIVVCNRSDHCPLWCMIISRRENLKLQNEKPESLSLLCNLCWLKTAALILEKNLYHFYWASTESLLKHIIFYITWQDHFRPSFKCNLPWILICFKMFSSIRFGLKTEIKTNLANWSEEPMQKRIFVPDGFIHFQSIVSTA